MEYVIAGIIAVVVILIFANVRVVPQALPARKMFPVDQIRKQIFRYRRENR